MSSPVSKSRFSAADQGNMQTALALAARGLGRTWPNPSVGCVLVNGGYLVGRGWTQSGGRPHAETVALATAGTAAKGSTVYVTLEPCSHHGRTPPCADALIQAGVSRVLVAHEDPDPRVLGAGIRRLREAGIQVELGLMAEEARDLNEGFLRRIADQRPMMTLKVATSLDGRIATRTGESRWITGECARGWGHGMRARHDAIMIGIGTALADDPDLTTRLPGLEARSPVRIVMDGRLRLPLTSRLVRTAKTVPTWVVTLPDADGARRRAFEECGVKVIEAGRPAAEDSLRPALEELARQGLTRILVEGGAHLSAALLREDLVDRLEWFRAGTVVGGDGVPAAAGFGIEKLIEARAFTRQAARTIGADVAESYRRAKPSIARS